MSATHHPFQHFRFSAFQLFLAVAWLAGANCSRAATATLYSTQFEASQGFNISNYLSGQAGWVSAGSGGNGLVTNAFAGMKQQAYVGYFAPAINQTSLAVWRPVNFNATNAPTVRFNVDMAIIDSSTTNRDEFSWSIYNSDGHRLFTLILDNYDLTIWHLLDDGIYRDTGWNFDNETNYSLQISMNFASNRWNASLNGTLVVTNKFITTTNAARTFGDADAEWFLRLANKAGDNYMVFDNYSVTADPLPQVIPSLQRPIAAGGGQQLLRVNGMNNQQYAVEASTNLMHWTSLKTNVVTGGYFDHLDTGAAGLRQRFYRARWVP